MMDGQVGHVRRALDEAGHTDTIVLAYAAKYASGFYGPFREAVSSSLQGDRATYQQDPANFTESLRETRLDIGGVRPDRGRRGPRVDRPRPRRAGGPDEHPPRRCAADPHLLRKLGSTLAELVVTLGACRCPE